ncbi:uncharacterized protein [Malus domestica]|uniref:uncharacterized protein isoform X3 n=1 Tax=Malus domestica TaxID=3750 RepID=UPI0039759D6D
MAGPGKCLLVTGPPVRLEKEVREWGSRWSRWTAVQLPSHPPPFPESLRWPTVGKYKVDVASFESLALPELQVREDTDLFIVDEVGKMELFSSSFFPCVLRILESNVPFLATVPIPKFGRDIPAVARLKNHPGATMFTLSKGNRDAVKEEIYSHLVALLSKQ